MGKYHKGPDQGWSWVIAISCCFINCLLYGVARLSGLLLVATVDTYQVSRASAALPFSISTSVRNLSGAFIGHLGHRFGVRPVIAAGCILASTGAGLCFFASDVMWITVCWGGLFGAGFGLATCLLPLAINQHFSKHRGTASGISYSGSYIGSFVFPPLIVLLLDKYGLPGTFLIISGGVLNVLAISMLFREPANNKIQENAINSKLSTKSSNKQDDRCDKILHKLLQDFRFKSSYLRRKELSKPYVVPSISLVGAIALNIDQEPKHLLEEPENRTNCGYEESPVPTSNSSSIPTLNSISTPKSTVPNCVPKVLLGPLGSGAKNCVSKGKFKLQYRLKLANLKKVVFVSFLKEKHTLHSELQFASENVKLTSFKYLHCLFCPHLAGVKYNPSLCSSLINLNTNDALTEGYSERYLKFKDDLVKELEFVKEEDFDEESAEGTSNFSRNLNIHGSLVQVPSATYDISKEPTYDIIDKQSNCHKYSHNHMYRVSFAPTGPTFSSKMYVKNKTKSSVVKCKRVPADTSSDPPNLLRKPSSFVKGTSNCFLGWFKLFAEPMFVTISGTMSLHTFVIVCVITIIEDFAKDLEIPENHVHYVLMVLSTADLLGTLTLGIITDRGILTRCHFIVLCFFGMSISVTVISFSYNFIMLLSLVAIYGIFESGVVITFPLLIGQFIEVKKQAVAIASSNILSCPTVLLVPLVIGHFRDHIGCYSGVFYILGATSFACSLIWLCVPYLFNKRRTKLQLDIQNSQS